MAVEERRMRTGREGRERGKGESERGSKGRKKG